jgi:hypothetical protein
LSAVYFAKLVESDKIGVGNAVARRIGRESVQGFAQALAVLICLLGGYGVARADWTYKTRITLLPSSTTTGFSVEGKTRVYFDARTSYVREPVPNLSDRKHAGRETELFDGVNTFFDRDPAGLIVPGNQVGGLASPAGKLMLGRYSPPGTIITSREETSGAYEIQEFNGGNSAVRTKTTFSKDGRIQSIVMFFADASPNHPIAKYDVDACDRAGNPTTVSITYFENGKAIRIEEFWLSSSSSLTPNSPNDLFAIGKPIVDERLGSGRNDQVPYEWDGTLPSVGKLRLMHNPSLMLTSGRTSKLLIVFGSLLAVWGMWIAVKRRRGRRHRDRITTDSASR